MKIQPLRDLLLIELDKAEETTNTGIFVTKAWEDAVSSCTVVEVGADCTIKKGDRVQINPYAYIDITGSPLKMIKEGDVLAYVG